MAWNFSFFLFSLNFSEYLDGSSSCSQRCENKIGTYKCSCVDGYSMTSDDHTCKRVDPVCHSVLKNSTKNSFFF